MKILLPVDGSPFTKKMLAYVGAHEELFGAAAEWALIHVQTPIPPRARAAVGKELVEKMQASLKDKAKEVRITFRLTDSPACLVVGEHELSGNLLRMLKAAGQAAPDTKPILEINPHHPLVQRLKYEEAKFDDWSSLLFDQAMLAEGGQLSDPAGFVKKLNDMLLGMALK